MLIPWYYCGFSSVWIRILKCCSCTSVEQLDISFLYDTTLVWDRVWCCSVCWGGSQGAAVSWKRMWELAWRGPAYHSVVLR